MIPRAIAVLALPLALTACDFVDSIGPSTCSRNFPDPDGGKTDPDDLPALYVDGTVDDSGVYRSELENGELLDFPGGAYWKIEHHLGKTPDWTLFYLSFSRYGLKQDGGGGVYAQASGNQAVLLGQDEKYILVGNDSCSDYYLRVVAGTGSPP